MKRLLLLVCVLLFVLLFGMVLEVDAVATVTSYATGCESFQAWGTTTAPYVVVEVYDPATGLDLFFDSFPVSGGALSVTAPYPVQAEGTILEYWVWGSPTPDPNDWDGEDYFYVTGPCVVPLGTAGIPAGFVFRSILCDTPVYDTPAGQPVGAARVTAGQTWYVNPVPVSGADGRQWTEIFVSSSTNPYVPTGCVN